MNLILTQMIVSFYHNSWVHIPYTKVKKNHCALFTITKQKN